MRISQYTKDNLTAAAVMLVILACILAVPPAQVRFIAGGIALGATAIFLLLLALFKQQSSQLDEARASLAAMGGVDPWAMQMELMKASDQPRPQDPTLTKGSLMYAALIMEEGSETFLQGVVPCLDRFITHALRRDNERTNVSPLKPSPVQTLRVVRGKIQECAHRMEVDSKIIRQHLKELPEFSFPMLRAEAVPVFDGTTDLAVVNCGFAIACGLDGAAGYLEVATSNLSKRNPESGVIDKTADGKWIKGVEYREPDLAGVLDNVADERGLQGLTACC